MTNEKQTSPTAAVTSRIAALAFTAATLMAQSIQLPTSPTDPFSHHDAAKAAQTRDPNGMDHLRNLITARTELGSAPEDTFQLINVIADDVGGTHARFQQF